MLQKVRAFQLSLRGNGRAQYMFLGVLSARPIRIGGEASKYQAMRYQRSSPAVAPSGSRGPSCLGGLWGSSRQMEVCLVVACLIFWLLFRLRACGCARCALTPRLRVIRLYARLYNTFFAILFTCCPFLSLTRFLFSHGRDQQRRELPHVV